MPRTKKAEAKTESERKALEHIERALGAEVPDGHTLSLSFDPLHFQLDRGNPIFRDIVVVKARLLSPDRRGRMRVRNWTRGDLNASYIVTMGDAGCRTSCTKSATKLAKVTRTVEEVIPIQEIGRSTGGGLVGAVGSVLLWAQGKGPIFEAAGPIGLGASIGVIVYGAKALQTRRVERRKAMRETVEWVRSEVRDGRYPHVSTIYSTYSEKAEDAGVHPKAFRAWLIELSIADLGADQAPKSDRTPQKSDS